MLGLIACMREQLKVRETWHNLSAILTTLPAFPHTHAAESRLVALPSQESTWFKLEEKLHTALENNIR